jgi:hypothetical protein
MRRSFCLCVGFLVCLGLPDQPRAGAAESGEEVRFETGDGMELQGSYYASEKAKKAPCVILLHKIGGSRKEEGWDTLATELQKKGYAVFAFDFRGHGTSTHIKDVKRFWTNPYNAQYVKGNNNPAKPKETFSYKDITNAAYYPMLANDIAAAKLYLDINRNDPGACNASSTILIGAEDGATLGALWMMSDWLLHRVTPSFGGPPKVEREPEGKDVIFGVWLSMTSSIRGNSMPTHEWIRQLGKTNKVPMAFVYGAKDSRGESFAKRAANEIKDKNNKFSGEIVIKDTNLAGVKLLNSNLDTQTEILKKLDEFMEEKPGPDWDRKDAKKNSYAWVRPAGVSLPAKDPESDLLNPIPFAQLGLLR